MYSFIIRIFFTIQIKSILQKKKISSYNPLSSKFDICNNYRLHDQIPCKFARPDFRKHTHKNISRQIFFLFIFRYRIRYKSLTRLKIRVRVCQASRRENIHNSPFFIMTLFYVFFKKHISFKILDFFTKCKIWMNYTTIIFSSSFSFSPKKKEVNSTKGDTY